MNITEKLRNYVLEVRNYTTEVMVTNEALLLMVEAAYEIEKLQKTNQVQEEREKALSEEIIDLVNQLRETEKAYSDVSWRLEGMRL